MLEGPGHVHHALPSQHIPPRHPAGHAQISADNQFFLLQLMTGPVHVGIRETQPSGDIRGRGPRLLRQNHEDSLLQGERFKRCIFRSSLGMGTKG